MDWMSLPPVGDLLFGGTSLEAALVSQYHPRRHFPPLWYNSQSPAGFFDADNKKLGMLASA